MQITTSITNENIATAINSAADKETVAALNNAARTAQQDLRNDLPKKFKLRSNWVKRGILYKQATLSNPVSEVYSANDFMALQEHGGVVSKRDKKIAIPTGIRTSGVDRLTLSQRPSKILKRPNTFINRGSSAIVRKIGSRLKSLYVLTDKIELRPRWGFKESVNATVDRLTLKNENAKVKKVL